MPPPTCSDEPPRYVEYPIVPEALNLPTNARNTVEPAYTLEGTIGSTASAPTMKFDKALADVVQLAPPFMVLKTPVLVVPTYTTPETVGSAALPKVLKSVKPGLTALQ